MSFEPLLSLLYIYIYIVYHKSEYTPYISADIKYISSWDNTDKMTR